MSLQQSLVAFVLIFSAVTGEALNLVPQQITVGSRSATLMVPEGMRVQFMAPASGARFRTLGPDKVWMKRKYDECFYQDTKLSCRGLISHFQFKPADGIRHHRHPAPDEEDP